jgi:hypothetical protein
MKTIYYKTISIAAFLLVTSLSVFSQSDSSLIKEVEVIKNYMPELTNTQKIYTNPNISDTTSYTPNFEYQIFSSDIPVEKNINHLPAVKLGGLPRNKSNTGYARAAFGNAFTPLAELVINSSPNNNTDFGMHLFHFSSSPKVTLLNQQKTKTPYSQSMARIFAKNTFRKSELNWNIAYNRQGLSYYGFPETDSALYSQQLSNSQTLNTKQSFNTASAMASIHNTNARANIDYKIQFGYNFLWNTTNQNAHHALYKGLYTRRYRSHHFKIDTKFEYFSDNNISHNFDASLNNHQYYHAALSPGLLYQKRNYDFYAGINLASLIHADSTIMWHISPKVQFAYHPINGILTLFAELDGGITPNNYMQLINNNRYANYTTDLLATHNILSVKGGLKGKLSNNFSYMFFIDYAINKNEAFYFMSKTISQTDTTINNMFDVEYDDMNRLTLGGKLRYSSNNLTVDLRGNYYTYDSKTLDILPHKPDFEIMLNSRVQITNKISAGLEASIIGPKQAIYKIFDTTTASTTPTVQIFDLETIINLNLDAEYQYSENMNFFITARNLLNKNHQYWHGYNSPGLLIMLGARYTF